MSLSHQRSESQLQNVKRPPAGIGGRHGYHLLVPPPPVTQQSPILPATKGSRPGALETIMAGIHQAGRPTVQPETPLGLPNILHVQAKIKRDQSIATVLHGSLRWEP